MRNFFRNAAIAALLFATVPAAQAAVQSYSFEGSLNALPFSGTFNFDDALATVFDPANPSFTVAPIASLVMNYGGTHYTLADAWGDSDVSFFDGAFLGLSYSNDAMSFIPGYFDVSEAFVTDGVSAANVIYAPVPEPETYAMLLAGLGLIGAIARRRATHA